MTNQQSVNGVYEVKETTSQSTNYEMRTMMAQSCDSITSDQAAHLLRKRGVGENFG